MSDQPTTHKLSGGPADAGANADQAFRDGDGNTEHELTRRLMRPDLTADDTPAPLPPLPATSSGRWLPSELTHPGVIPDLGALASANDAGSARTSSNESMFAPVILDQAGSAAADANRAARRGLHGVPRLLPLLIAATSLAVGMVLGALLFGSRGDKASAPVVECAEPAATSPGSSR